MDTNITSDTNLNIAIITTTLTTTTYINYMAPLYPRAHFNPNVNITVTSPTSYPQQSLHALALYLPQSVNLSKLVNMPYAVMTFRGQPTKMRLEPTIDFGLQQLEDYFNLDGIEDILYREKFLFPNIALDSDAHRVIKMNYIKDAPDWKAFDEGTFSNLVFGHPWGNFGRFI